MRHNFTLAGPAFRIRPIEDRDAAFVLELRGNAKLNQYVHVTPPRLEDQLDWLAQYYGRSGDYYFAIERSNSNTPEGVISIYEIDDQIACGEWGRWMLRTGSLAAVESVWLIYRFAFELLNLKTVFCRTVAENMKVVSFHDSCGIVSRRLLAGHFLIGDRRLDAVEHQVSRKQWEEIGPRMENLAQAIARKVLR